MKKLAIFASGNGSNFQAIFDSLKLGETDAEISLVVSDKPHAGVIERAQSVNVPAYCFIPKEYETKADYEHAILSVLQNNKIDFVILAGYMRLIGDTLLNAYAKRIVNIHPSLLPAFPGKDAIGQAFQAGVKVTGVTVHFVDAGMDTGPIIAQKAIEIEAGDTIEAIAKKIHKVEHMLYPKVIKELVSK